MAKSLYEFCMEMNETALLEQWDGEKNGTLTARDVSKASHRSVWWKCDLGHEWQAVVYSRTTLHSGCPVCARRRTVLPKRKLAEEYPKLAGEWHPSLNGSLTPDDVAPGTHRKIWWQCEKGHVWNAEIKSRTQGASCPVCSNKKVIQGLNDLVTTHPELAAQWHPEKNGALTPQAVTQGKHKAVWWRCEKGHDWKAEVYSRTNEGCCCPVCAGKVVVPGFNDLASQKPELAAQWHPEKNGKRTPQAVTPFSNRYAWWICEKGHEYRSLISKRSHSGSGCPYCKNKKVLVGFNDLATLEPKVAAQWHPVLNGELTPQMVTTGSARSVWWQCGNGHVWKTVIYSRARGKKHGCPVCAGNIKPKNDRF